MKTPSDSMVRFRKGVRAFSLIELLVVIAVIALVAGLLLPALTAAKTTAIATQCLNNKKQLQMGWFLYAQDHDDQIPPNGEVLAGPARTNNQYWWAQGTMNYEDDHTDNTNVNLLIDPKYARLGDYTKNPGVYKCPDDKSSTIIAGRNHSRVRSVSMNVHAADASPQNARRAANDSELQKWIENMVWYHHFTKDEMIAATGLTATEVDQALARFSLRSDTNPPVGNKLVVLPYPGGRHPRIGFLEGAVDPQRETKLSVFTPWDENSYVVADIPEAIWSNLGLTYLAHTHVPTIWTKQNVQLPPLEWEKLSNGDYRMERTLPNGIRFGTLAHPTSTALLMKMWLSNGTSQALSDLRVQNCVMLKGAVGFNQQSDTNKVLRAPFAACRSESGDRWIITGWKPIQRAWSNPPVPCIHADPKFPDTKPGEQHTLEGILTFYTGRAINDELSRLEAEWDKLMKF